MERIARWKWIGIWTACSLAAGCGTSTTGPGAGSPVRPALSAGERIAGAWQGTMLVDDEAVAGKLSVEQVGQLEAMEMGMEFGADGSLLLTGIHGGRPYTSRNQWKLVKETGEEITIRSIEPSGTAKEIVLVFQGDDVFLLPMKTEVAELGAMRFERLR